MNRELSLLAKLMRLERPVQEALWKYLADHTIEEGAAWVREQCGTAVSWSAVQRWYSAYPSRSRGWLMGDMAQEVVAARKAVQPEIPEAKLEAYGQKVFTRLAIHAQEAEAWVAAKKVEFEREKLRLKEREMELNEEKFAFLKQQAEKAREVIGSPMLSPEEKEREMKRILGME